MAIQSKTRNLRRAGFTLIETIVTVGLIAVMAAFVIPSVIQKSQSADPVKVQNDLTAVRTGMEEFSTDTKSGFPNQIRMLTNPPVATNHLVDSTTLLSPGQIAIWNGPYLNATIGTQPNDSIRSGFNAFIHNHIQRWDAIHNAGEFYGGSGPTAFAAGSTLFTAVKITGLTATQAAIINSSIDGIDDINVQPPATNAGANTTGRFRFDAPVGGFVTAYYLASPIT
jgi:prepilin-type N-terminal cleavage/methylation domain-containing protein